MRTAGGVLSQLLRVMVMVGCVALVFGMSYAFIALYAYGGAVLILGDVAPALLRTYAAYIPFLALNGVSESFLFATLSPSDIDRYDFNSVFGFSWHSHVFSSFSITFLKFSHPSSLYRPLGFLQQNSAHKILNSWQIYCYI